MQLSFCYFLLQKKADDFEDLLETVTDVGFNFTHIMMRKLDLEPVLKLEGNYCKAMQIKLFLDFQATYPKI